MRPGRICQIRSEPGLKWSRLSHLNHIQVRFDGVRSPDAKGFSPRLNLESQMAADDYDASAFDRPLLETKRASESPMKSSCFDYIFSLCCFACVTVPLSLGIADDNSIALGYLIAWLFLIVRVHLHIWWLGGLSGFFHLVWRFPATWLNTVTFYPIFVGCKLSQWVICEILYFDHVGQLYKCKGTGFTLERYARMTRDLDKPLIFRKGDTYMNFTIYPFMLSTQLACNIYSMGPYTGFGDNILLDLPFPFLLV